MSIHYTKSPLTFDEQLARLEGRGLDLGDRARAREALERIGYYRLSAYWLPFKGRQVRILSRPNDENVKLLFCRGFCRPLELLDEDGPLP